MARDRVQGQSYPGLDRVSDPGTREVLRVLMDQINSLRQPSATQDLGGNKITGLSSPTSASDAVTKEYVDNLVAGVRSNLLGSGSTPLDVTALRGQLSQVQRAMIRIIYPGNPRPSTGQPFELIYDENGAGRFYYYDASTNTWIGM